MTNKPACMKDVLRFKVVNKIFLCVISTLKLLKRIILHLPTAHRPIADLAFIKI